MGGLSLQSTHSGTKKWAIFGVEKISNGDEIEIDYEKGVIKNKTAGTDIEFRPLPDFALDIIKAGGLLKHIKSSVKE